MLIHKKDTLAILAIIGVNIVSFRCSFVLHLLLIEGIYATHYRVSDRAHYHYQYSLPVLITVLFHGVHLLNSKVGTFRIELNP